MSGRKYARQGTTMRRKKRDANEKAIIQALEAIPGCMVVPLDKPVDLLIGYNGYTILAEVKNPKGKNRLEPDQVKFIDEWPGSTVHVIHDEVEALRLIGQGASGLSLVRVPR